MPHSHLPLTYTGNEKAHVVAALVSAPWPKEPNDQEMREVIIERAIASIPSLEPETRAGMERILQEHRSGAAR